MKKFLLNLMRRPVCSKMYQTSSQHPKFTAYLSKTPPCLNLVINSNTQNLPKAMNVVASLIAHPPPLHPYEPLYVGHVPTETQLSSFYHLSFQ